MKKIDLFKKSLDPATAILSLYFSLAALSYVFLNVGSNKILLLSVFVALLVGSYLLLDVVVNKIRATVLESVRVFSTKEKLCIFLITTVVVLAWLMVWFYAYFPGSFTRDSITTFRQAYSGTYSDWHPAWYTMFSQAMPLKVFGSAQAGTFLQILYFSLIMGYLTLTIAEMSSLKVAIWSLIIILINPYNCYIILYQIKDVTFSLAGALCLVYAVRLMLKLSTPKLWKIVLFGFALASATIFRHNAILFTAPLMLVMFLNIDRKTFLKTLACTIVFFILIKGPVYHAFNVEKPDRRVSETTGLFLSIIGNVAKETPERMDKELSDFVYSLGSRELWDSYEFRYGFNSVKWNGADVSVVEEQGIGGMLHLTAKCFMLSPYASMAELVNITSLVYGFEDAMKGYFVAEVEPNEFGISYSEKTNLVLQEMVSSYANTFNTSIFKYIRTFGVWMFLILLVCLSKLKFSSWESWKKALIIVPLFAHNFGTMLLQTAPEARFFYITYLIGPILIVYLLKGQKDQVNFV